MAQRDRFTEKERAYLATQTLGRLATVDPHGAPQNSPVGFTVNADGTIDIGGRDMGRSRKFRNIAQNNQVAFVVDDFSVRPWTVRFVEIRGVGEQLWDQNVSGPGKSREVIRIHPRHIIGYGIDDEGPR